MSTKVSVILPKNGAPLPLIHQTRYDMARSFLLALFISFLFACNPPSEDKQALQKRIDGLEKQLAESYKPGFGEFMSDIQAHHAKLWFAGQHQNWKLADFEVHEIIEAITAIQQYQTERKESQQVGMLLPALDSVNLAIEQKNQVLFKRSFVQLTNTCNNCHRATDFGFNRVKVPDASAFSNKDFGVEGK